MARLWETEIVITSVKKCSGKPEEMRR